MTMSLRVLALLLSSALAACVADDGPTTYDELAPDEDGNDNGDNPAGGDLRPSKALFDSGVYPTIATKCSTNACHAETATGVTLTRFVATDPARGWQVATNYAVLVGTNHAMSNAPVLTLITPGTHKNVTYTTDEAMKIAAWLESEIGVRNGQAIAPFDTESLSQATKRVRDEFVACMTLQDFTAANMANAWGALEAQNNQRCSECHAAAGEGFIATDQTETMFTALTTNPALLMHYVSADLTMGAPSAKMVINLTSHRGVAQGEDPHREHPRYNATNNRGMTALAQLYNATMARKAAGTCAPPSARTW